MCVKAEEHRGFSYVKAGMTQNTGGRFLCVKAGITQTEGRFVCCEGSIIYQMGIPKKDRTDG